MEDHGGTCVLFGIVFEALISLFWNTFRASAGVCMKCPRFGIFFFNNSLINDNRETSMNLCLSHLKIDK